MRDPRGWVPNGLAIAYVLAGYAGGWWLMFQGIGWLWLAGVLLVAHAMVIAGYLMHDFAHNAVFTDNAVNARVGRLLNMLCGANYGTYEDMRNKHVRHHVDNCDTVTFDYRRLLRQRPWLLKVVKLLEWFYIPAVELLMHGAQIVLPFVSAHMRHLRPRVLRVALVRWPLLALAGWLQPAALLGYALAYLLFLTVLRFMDTFQHDYELFYKLGDPSFSPPHKGDKAYEQSHTYTNLLSARWPALNLLVLNFCYHNAHHARPTAPWYRLPRLAAELKVPAQVQRLRFGAQLRSFHRNRVSRVLAEQYGEERLAEQLPAGRAVGVDAVSFLTAF